VSLRLGEEFLGAIDTSGHRMDVVYIADVIKRYLIEVGPQNVLQVCTINASMMRKAVSIVQEEWPHLYFQGCIESTTLKLGFTIVGMLYS
jgi:hypothetical protein